MGVQTTLQEYIEKLSDQRKIDINLRTQQFSVGIQTFLDRHENVVLFSDFENVETASLFIALNYFYYLDQNVNRLLIPKDGVKRANIFKIASATEIVLVKIKPFRYKNSPETEIDRLNSEFAFNFCTRMVADWHEVPSYAFESILQNEPLQVFISEHLSWLSQLASDDDYNFPVFVNSQCWRLFFYNIVNPIIFDLNDYSRLNK